MLKVAKNRTVRQNNIGPLKIIFFLRFLQTLVTSFQNDLRRCHSNNSFEVIARQLLTKAKIGKVANVV